MKLRSIKTPKAIHRFVKRLAVMEGDSYRFVAVFNAAGQELAVIDRKLLGEILERAGLEVFEVPEQGIDWLEAVPRERIH
jgi:hypothetical protein